METRVKKLWRNLVTILCFIGLATLLYFIARGMFTGLILGACLGAVFLLNSTIMDLNLKASKWAPLILVSSITYVYIYILLFYCFSYRTLCDFMVGGPLGVFFYKLLEE